MNGVLEKELVNKGIEMGMKMAGGLSESRGFDAGWRACLKKVKSMALERDTLSVTIEELELL